MTSTLTDLLRDLPDEELAALLRLRPDLVAPVPADLSALAARAQSRVSVARALDQLNRFQLEILDGLRLTRGAFPARSEAAGHTSLDQLLAAATAPERGVDAATVRAAVQRLRAYLLVHGPDEALHVLPAVDEVLGSYPAGLGRPGTDLDAATADLVQDAARLRRTVLSAPPAARAVLNRLAADGPVGSCADPHDQESPVGWLVSRGLLVATSPGAVELPREVGLLLRRDTGPLGALHPSPPEPEGAPVPVSAADEAGAGQALEVVLHTEALLEAFAAEPAPVLRTGGIGVRDLRRLARAAGLTEPVAALLIETSAAAGLLGMAEVSGNPGRGAAELRPAAGYDAWRAAAIANRWHALATAWLTMPRAPGLVGQRDGRDRVIGALTAEVEHGGVPAARRAALTVLANLAPGAVVTVDELLELLAWHTPRRSAGREPAVRQLWTEAAQLGFTGRGALTTFGAALVAELGDAGEPEDPLGIHAGDSPTAATKATAILDGLLPAPVDEVLLQADLTVVVPGPPDPVLSAELELVAEPESAGGASVHRITADSLRRALDAGYTAEDLHGLFARRSRTPVPQSLTYLVEDVARAHGGLRVGSAGAYLRSDDEALLAQAVADRRLAVLGLRRLAPTVLVSAGPPARLLQVLRDAGYAPVQEDGSGAAVLVRPRTSRAPARTPVAPPANPFQVARPSTPRLLGIIEDIRRADAAVRAARRAPANIGGEGQTSGAAAAQAHTEALAVLQQAVRDKVAVWIGYVDARGTTMRRLLRPVSIGAGYLRAEDERSDTVHTFALHRITGAAPVSDA